MPSCSIDLGRPEVRHPGDGLVRPTPAGSRRPRRCRRLPVSPSSAERRICGAPSAHLRTSPVENTYQGSPSLAHDERRVVVRMSPGSRDSAGCAGAGLTSSAGVEQATQRRPAGRGADAQPAATDAAHAVRPPSRTTYQDTGGSLHRHDGRPARSRSRWPAAAPRCRPRPSPTRCGRRGWSASVASTSAARRSAASVDLELTGSVSGAVDGEHGDLARLGVAGRDGVERARRRRTWRSRASGDSTRDLQHVALRVPGGQRERVEDRLLPGPAAGLGHDRRDHVDQLRQATRSARGRCDAAGRSAGCRRRRRRRRCTCPPAARARRASRRPVGGLDSARSWYQTFHSSNEMWIRLVCLLVRAHVVRGRDSPTRRSGPCPRRRPGSEPRSPSSSQ